MRYQDEMILRAYFGLEETQRQRLWMTRIWHPELFHWDKQGAPPTMTEATRIRQSELAKLGYGEEHYQLMVGLEKEAEEQLITLAADHTLAPHFLKIKGLSLLTCGKFVAAGGDIERPPTVSAFWKGMGLDVLPDGTVPRRIRGHKKVERKVPCLPHVSRVGEQIRQQILRSQGRLYAEYKAFRERYDGKYPDRPKIWNMKAALRGVQKTLYACLWREWRIGAGLPAPEPYAFDILQHAPQPLRIEWFYEPEGRPTNSKNE